MRALLILARLVWLIGVRRWDGERAVAKIRDLKYEVPTLSGAAGHTGPAPTPGRGGPNQMNFPVLFRHAQRPRLMPAEEYRRYRWYEMGSTMEPFAAAYRGASQDGFECRMAYNAGVIARTFGVDLSEILNLSK